VPPGAAGEAGGETITVGKAGALAGVAVRAGGVSVIGAAGDGKVPTGGTVPGGTGVSTGVGVTCPVEAGVGDGKGGGVTVAVGREVGPEAEVGDDVGVRVGRRVGVGVSTSVCTDALPKSPSPASPVHRETESWGTEKSAARGSPISPPEAGNTESWARTGYPPATLPKKDSI
jgi:hypothetical protein